MVDLSVTASAVVPGSNSVQAQGIAGEAIVQGKAVYLDASTQRWMLADNNSAIATARRAQGISLNSASASQPITVHKSGLLTFNAIFTAGVGVYLSDTPGGLAPVADVGAGEYVCLIGFPVSTTVLDVNIQYPNVSL
jgi:hypothetical protein